MKYLKLYKTDEEWENSPYNDEKQQHSDRFVSLFEQGPYYQVVFYDSGYLHD